MPSLVVLYPMPTDVAEFDRRYEAEHKALVRDHFGMARFRALRATGAPGGAPMYHLVVELAFDSAEQMQAALSTPGGTRTAQHAGEISSGGPPVMVICEES